MPGAVLASALGHVALRADQQSSVDKVKADLDGQAAPVREAKAKLGAALADQVRAGKVDRAALGPLVDGLVDAVTQTKPAFQQALNDLHGTLDAKQRVALVDAVKDEMKEMRGNGGHDGHARFEKMAKDLALTEAQIDTIKAQVKTEIAGNFAAHRGERGAMKAKMEKVGEAFASDSFDAKALDVGDGGATFARRRSEMIEAVIEAAVPVLTPAQRGLLADQIKARSQGAAE